MQLNIPSAPHNHFISTFHRPQNAEPYHQYIPARTNAKGSNTFIRSAYAERIGENGRSDCGSAWRCGIKRDTHPQLRLTHTKRPANTPVGRNQVVNTPSTSLH
jgi:hypothetical protein